MIDLDSPRWHELRDAYRRADHIPAILRRLAAGEEAWMELYDTLALIGRGRASDGALATLPHLWRIAETCELRDRFEHVVFAGRVAYTAHGFTSQMDAGVVEEAVAAFRGFSATAKQLLPETAHDFVFDVAESILALEQCPILYDAVQELGQGGLTIVCPGELCGVAIELQRRGARMVAVVDEAEVEVEVEPTAGAAFDPAAGWTESDALPRLVALARAAGHPEAAHKLELLGGAVACPKCGDRMSLYAQLLEPSEL